MSAHQAKTGMTAPFAGMVLVFLALLIPTQPLLAAGKDFEIEIIKSAQELILKRGNQPYRTFRMAYGKDDGAKRQRGDNKTPVGTYTILEFKPDSKFHFFMQLNYPNMLDAWHGYKDRLISPAEFRQIALSYKNHKMPPQNTRLGGYIGIHGVGEITSEKMKIHQSVNWTDGCIALTNEEINILRKYVTIGTPVIIRN